MITQTHDLNLIPGSVPPVVNVTQYDKTARTLVFNLWDGETSFSVPSGAAVTIRGTKPDGNGFEYTATASGSTVSMDLQQQMATCAGSVRCEVRIASGTQIIGTADFILEVKPSALNESTPLSETELPLIEKAAEGAAKIEANLSASNTAASNAAKSASQAASSASAASGSASAAASSASAAKTSETNAASSASSASSSATAAGTSEKNAAASATSAGASASSASASETKTKQYMEQAAGYAGAASYSFMVDADGYICLNYKEETA